MKKFWVALSRQHWARWLFRGLRLSNLYDCWLEIFPRVRTLPATVELYPTPGRWFKSVTYRARRSESVSLAYEILEGGGVYPLNLIRWNAVECFLDLGCNVGLFSVLAHAHWPGAKAILVDANQAVLDEAAWHVAINAIDAQLVLGCIGSAVLWRSTRWHTVSTAYWNEHWPDWFSKAMQPIMVRRISLDAVLDGRRVDLAKIDIEGAEFALVDEAPQFFSQVGHVFLETHFEVGSFKILRAKLEKFGLMLDRVIESGPNSSVSYFRRP